MRRHTQQWRVLKARLDRLHRAGLAALASKEYGRFGAAIVEEQRLVREHREVLRAAAARLRRVRHGNRVTGAVYIALGAAAALTGGRR